MLSARSQEHSNVHEDRVEPTEQQGVLRPGHPSTTSLQRVAVRERRSPGTRPVKVEQRRRGDVVVQWQISAAGLPAEGLDLDAQVVSEMDGIRNVPTVETEPLLALVEAVRPDHLGHAEVRRGVFGIALARDVEIPGAAEVVLSASAADRRVIVVAIEIDLEVALAPHQPGLFTPQAR